MQNSIRIAQFTDLHLFGNKDEKLLGVNTYQSFFATLNLLKSATHQPDLILMTGDLSQDHSKLAYQHIADAFKTFTIPILYVPGNHDDQTLMIDTFSSTAISNVKQMLLGEWQLILLDSQKPKAVEGYLSHTQLDFLESCLKKYPQHHTILVFHHHPIPVGSAWLDKLGLENADELWSMLAHYPAVNTLLFGHVHQEYQSEKQGVRCYSTPSTSIQFKRNATDFALEKLPPAYRWIDLYQNGDLKTGVCRVPNYEDHADIEAKGY